MEFSLALPSGSPGLAISNDKREKVVPIKNLT